MTATINNHYFPIEHPPIASVMAVVSVLCKIRRNPYFTACSYFIFKGLTSTVIQKHTEMNENTK